MLGSGVWLAEAVGLDAGVAEEAGANVQVATPAGVQAASPAATRPPPATAAPRRNPRRETPAGSARDDSAVAIGGGDGTGAAEGVLFMGDSVPILLRQLAVTDGTSGGSTWPEGTGWRTMATGSLVGERGEDDVDVVGAHEALVLGPHDARSVDHEEPRHR